MELKPSSIRALQLYSSKFGVPFFKPDYVSYSFIPMFKRLGFVWIHVSSVVRFCHLHNPDGFQTLNRDNLLQISNPHHVINNGKQTRSFRLIETKQFEQITGVKVDG